MRLRGPLVGALLAAVVAALLFQIVQRELAEASLAFGAHPEVLELLERSLADQKRLAALDSDERETYRRSFAEIEATLHRLQILRHNREEVVARAQIVLLLLFVVAVLAIAGGLVWRESRREARLERLREDLETLAVGRAVTHPAARGGGTIGRIAAMVEDTSHRMVGDRQRLAVLENLSAWQEAARRQAHEMRTPLTALGLELSRLEGALSGDGPPSAELLLAHLEEARHELERLAEFTRRFSSFARLPTPRLARVDLGGLLVDLVEVYQGAWSNLELSCETPGERLYARVDRDQLRQVMVNLWENSVAAAGEDPVRVTVSVRPGRDRTIVEVADDGPGIAAQVSDRLFQPYVTTRGVGEGMGLGLAISRKILLDHGGDLALAASSPLGATFELSLPPEGDVDSDATSDSP